MLRMKPENRPAVSGGINTITNETITIQVRVQGATYKEVKDFKAVLAQDIMYLVAQRPRQKRHNVAVMEVAVDQFPRSANLL